MDPSLIAGLTSSPNTHSNPNLISHPNSSTNPTPTADSIPSTSKQVKVTLTTQPAISSSFQNNHDSHQPQPSPLPQPPNDAIPHLTPSILTILSESGFHSSTPSTLSTLSNQLHHFLTAISALAANLTQASGRNKVNARDLLAAFVGVGIVGEKYPRSRTRRRLDEKDEEEVEDSDEEAAEQQDLIPDPIQEEFILLEEMKDLVHRSKIRDYLLASEPDSVGFRNRFPVGLDHDQVGEQDEDAFDDEEFRFTRQHRFLSSDDEEEEEEEEEAEAVKRDGDGSEFNETLDEVFKSIEKSPMKDQMEDLEEKRKECRTKRKKLKQRSKIGVGLEGEINRKKKKPKFGKKDATGKDVEMEFGDGKMKEKGDSTEEEEMVEIGGLLSHLPDLPPRHTWVRTEAYVPRISSSSSSNRISLDHLDLKLQSSRLTSISLRGLIRGMESAETFSRSRKLMEQHGVVETKGDDEPKQGNGDESKANGGAGKEGDAIGNQADRKDVPMKEVGGSDDSNLSSKQEGPADTHAVDSSNSIQAPSTPTPSTSTSTSTSTNKPRTLLRLRMPSASGHSNRESPITSGSSTPQPIPLTALPRNMLPETNPSFSNRRFTVGNISSPTVNPIQASGVGVLNSNQIGASGLSTPIRRSTFSNLNLQGGTNPMNHSGLESPITPWTPIPNGFGSNHPLPYPSSVPQTPSFNYPNTPMGITGTNLNFNPDGRRDSSINDLEGIQGIDVGLNLNLPASVNFKKDWYSIDNRQRQEGGTKPKEKSKKKKKVSRQRRWLI